MYIRGLSREKERTRESEKMRDVHDGKVPVAEAGRKELAQQRQEGVYSSIQTTTTTTKKNYKKVQRTSLNPNHSSALFLSSGIICSLMLFREVESKFRNRICLKKMGQPVWSHGRIDGCHVQSLFPSEKHLQIMHCQTGSPGFHFRPFLPTRLPSSILQVNELGELLSYPASLGLRL